MSSNFLKSGLSKCAELVSAALFCQGQMVIVAALLLIPFAANSKGRVVYSNPELQTWANPACKGDVDCGIREFRLITQKYRVDFSETFQGDRFSSFGDKAYMEIMTNGLGNIEKYGVVQFVRGCQFNSHLENGEVVKSSQISRYFFDGIYVFHHPQWVVDSIDSDPVYNSAAPADRSGMKNPSRLGFYRWATDGRALEGAATKALGDMTPDNPRLFLRDRPSTALVSEAGNVQNISLEFKTCIYPLEGVPEIATDPTAPIEGALTCLNWRSSWIFNFGTQKFESPAQIDPYCEAELPPHPGITRVPGGWKFDE